MEQTHSTGPAPAAQAAQQAIFERVWRRVMPEDRPDCPFTLQAPPEPGATAPHFPLMETDPALPALAPHQSPPVSPPPAVSPPPPPVSLPPAAPALPPTAPPPQAPPQAAPSAQPVPAPGEALPPSPPENDVPHLGAASAVHGAQLQAFLTGALADRRLYQALFRRAPGQGGRVLGAISADKYRHAKRLSAAYFLISGVRFWPDRGAPAPASTYRTMLRQRFVAEQQGELNYLAAAAETQDDCLQALYRDLAQDEARHAEQIRALLEQL